MLKDLILKARSIRRFDNSYEIDNSLLIEVVDMVRNTASARNIQPLKYATTTNRALCEKIFPTLKWAGYLEDGTPKQSEQPTGYIIIYNDKSISPSSLWDQGIVSQTISMALAERGLGCCIIASVNREQLKSVIATDDTLEAVLVLAVGKGVEQVELVDIKDNNHKYYRNDKGVHFVPKRTLNDIYIDIESITK